MRNVDLIRYQFGALLRNPSKVCLAIADSGLSLRQYILKRDSRQTMSEEEFILELENALNAF
jgi:hypothetical protein